MQATKAWKKKQNEKTWSKTNASLDVLRCMVVRLARACMTGTFTRNRRNIQRFFSIATQSQHEPPSADSPFAKEVASLAEAGRGLSYPNRRMGPLLSEGPRNAKKPTPKTGFYPIKP